MNKLKKVQQIISSTGIDIENISEDFFEWKNWGFKVNLFKSKEVAVDFLHVVQGWFCSFHHHDYLLNRFFVLRGVLEIEYEYNNIRRFVELGIQERKRVWDIIPGNRHRFKALDSYCQLIEIAAQRESFWNDKDIFRVDEGGIDE